MQSTHDAAEFMQVFHRMGTYAPGSTPFFPQLLVPGGNNSNRSPMPGPIQQKMADYLAGVNLSNAETLGLSHSSRSRGSRAARPT